MLQSALGKAYDDFSQISLEKLHRSLTVLEGSTPSQWRVTVKDNPSTTATVSWSTQEGDGEHRLYYGKKSSKGNLKGYTHNVACQRNGQYTYGDKAVYTIERKMKEVSGEFVGGHYHHARLSNLEPDTTYYLTMVSNGVASKEFQYRTAPQNPNKMRLIYGADSRTGIAIRSRFNHMIGSMVQKYPDIFGLVHGGDYITNGPSYGEWRGWMSQNELLITPENRIIPIIPVRGNHDDGALYGEIFDFEDNQKTTDYCYAVTFGKHLSVLTLDTNVAGTGEQERFVNDQLATLRPSCSWLLTAYHTPLFPAVKDAPAHKKVFTPLFEKYNVDLSLEADGHLIKRTVPIRNNKYDKTGVTYIGEGGMGAGMRKAKKKRWYLSEKDGAFTGRSYHIHFLHSSSEKLLIETVLLTGKVVDSHELKVR
jgi:hypothetical protein